MTIVWVTFNIRSWKYSESLIWWLLWQYIIVTQTYVISVTVLTWNWILFRSSIAYFYVVFVLLSAAVSQIFLKITCMHYSLIFCNMLFILLNFIYIITPSAFCRRWHLNVFDSPACIGVDKILRCFNLNANL
jgi:hypothetical protein